VTCDSSVVSTPASSITKTGRHEIAEILLKVALISFQLIFKNTNVGPLYQEWVGSRYSNPFFQY
jgi:hypothetical protein